MKFKGIQILRAVAALLVLLFHITGSSNETFSLIFLYNTFAFGSCGVDIFFVLSGFIIAYTSKIIIGNPTFFGIYLWKRFARLFPIYWIIIIVFLLSMTLVGYKSGHDLSFLSLFESFILYPNHDMINGVSWSLSYELYFYIVFGLLILSRRFIWLVLIIFFLTVSQSLGFFEFHNSLSKFLFSNYNYLFLTGVLSSYIITSYDPIFSNALVLKFLILSVSISFLVTGVFFHSSSYSIFLYCLFTFLIILLLCNFEFISKVSSLWKPLVFLGDSSYVLYLIHLPIIRVGHRVFKNFVNGDLAALHLLNLLLVIIVCYLSILIFKFIEKPIIKFSHTISNRMTVRI